MDHQDRHPDHRAPWRRSLGRAAAVAVAIAALATIAVAPGAAGAATGPRTATDISTIKNAKLGTLLVADETVYTLKPSKTACTAKCLAAWPPVELPAGVMAATAGTGVDASKLGTKPTADGALQVTYGGKPLYWFVKDTATGQVKGNITDKWGKWLSVVTVASKSHSGGSNAGTGGVSF
jgi:predicted lipoprotein with Yx(FWY)xxD motif